MLMVMPLKGVAQSAATPDDANCAVRDSIILDLLANDTTLMPTPQSEGQGYVVVAPRTNLLLPLLNVGVEVPLGNRWSVAADWYYPWLFRNNEHKYCYQALGLSLEGRVWFGRNHRPGAENRKNRLLGHSVGAFVMSGKYDLERNYSGHQGEYVMGGVDYLFAMPVFKRKMHMEFSLGVGYFFSRATAYDVFEPGGRGYRDKNIRKRITYFGPLKAGVTLVWPIKTKKNTDRR